MSHSYPRNFKGIWIPAELWLDRRLNPQEKCMIAEIDSLDCGEQHCFASNEYLMNFFNLKLRTLQRILNRLKSLNFIEVITDGFKRTIKSKLKYVYNKTRDDKFDTPPRQFCHANPIVSPLGRDNIVDNIVKEKPPTPLKKGREDWWGCYFKNVCSREEFDEAWKDYDEQPYNKVKDIKAWLSAVIERQRCERLREDTKTERVSRHREEARKHDNYGKENTIVAAPNGVEFIRGLISKIVPYDLPDEEWHMKTKYEFVTGI